MLQADSIYDKMICLNIFLKNYKSNLYNIFLPKYEFTIISNSNIINFKILCDSHNFDVYWNTETINELFAVKLKQETKRLPVITAD